MILETDRKQVFYGGRPFLESPFETYNERVQARQRRKVLFGPKDSFRIRTVNISEFLAQYETANGNKSREHLYSQEPGTILRLDEYNNFSTLARVDSERKLEDAPTPKLIKLLANIIDKTDTREIGCHSLVNDPDVLKFLNWVDAHI